jgi:hypothetical protein
MATRPMEVFFQPPMPPVRPRVRFGVLYYWFSDYAGDCPVMAIGAMETGILTQVMSGGTGTATGSDEIGPWAQALPIAAHIAQPGVNVAGLMISGVVVAPPATLGKPGCIALDCGSAGWGMAAIPLFSEAVPSGAPARSKLLGSAKSQGSAISLTTLTEQELP